MTSTGAPLAWIRTRPPMRARQFVVGIEEAFAVDALDPAHRGHDRGIAQQPGHRAHHRVVGDHHDREAPIGPGILGLRRAAAAHEPDALRGFLGQFTRPAGQRGRQEGLKPLRLQVVQKLRGISGFGQRVLDLTCLIGLDRGVQRVGDVVGEGRRRVAETPRWQRLG